MERYGVLTGVNRARKERDKVDCHLVKMLNNKSGNEGRFTLHSRQHIEALKGRISRNFRGLQMILMD